MSWFDNGFLAPESLLDDKGQRIMWAWARDERDRETERPACGWSGIFSPPCEMVIENGRIGLKPIEELQSITDGGDNRYVKLGPGDEVTVAGVAHRSLDVCALFMLKCTYRYGVNVCKSPQGEEENVIGIDLRSRTLFVDTSSSSMVTGRKTVEGAPLPERAEQNGADWHFLRILVSNSIVEAFACGTQAMRRIYPSRNDSVYVSYWAEGGNCELDVALTEVKRTNPY